MNRITIERAARAMADSICYATDDELMNLCNALAGVILLSPNQMFDSISDMDDAQIYQMCLRIAKQQVAVAAMQAGVKP